MKHVGKLQRVHPSYPRIVDIKSMIDTAQVAYDYSETVNKSEQVLLLHFKYWTIARRMQHTSTITLENGEDFNCSSKGHGFCDWPCSEGNWQLQLFATNSRELKGDYLNPLISPKIWGYNGSQHMSYVACVLMESIKKDCSVSEYPSSSYISILSYGVGKTRVQTLSNVPEWPSCGP